MPRLAYAWGKVPFQKSYSLFSPEAKDLILTAIFTLVTANTGHQKLTQL